ncbi:MAG: transglycosylase family protein, partial [Propionicimonas sp.]
ARAAMWDRIAKCESGNRWNINTGNGYYGGLQFNKASWNANGGRDFAALPHQASRAEQITVANRYYAKAGLKPWGCRHAA